jgi:tetratricopeptide (TPR) repeat protein
MEIEMGAFDSALDTLSRSYELKKRLGNADGIGVSLNNLGWLRTARGDLEEAEEDLNSALELAIQIGYLSLIRQTRKNIGEMHLNAYRWEEARHVLIETVDALKEANVGSTVDPIVCWVKRNLAWVIWMRHKVGCAPLICSWPIGIRKRNFLQFIAVNCCAFAAC